MNYQWNYIEANEDQVQSLARALNVSNTISKLLVQRNIFTYKEAEQFFVPKLEQLNDPFLMQNMDIAVSRLEKAIKAKQKIWLYGDYDVDGTTSVSLLMMLLKQKTSNIDFYIPDREEEGYGVSSKGIKKAISENVQLLITLDCGIKAVKELKEASEANIDVIVCDHHKPGDMLPNVFAILNPKQKTCLYPYKELSGCGIAFKLAQGLLLKTNESLEPLIKYIDLTCISIACDIVPITKENRILAYHGLKKINTKPSIGVKNIISQISLQNPYTISDVVFKIGPRINAAGRIAHAKDAVNVLTGKEDSALLQLKNNERKIIDKEITETALDMLKEEDPSRFVNVVYQKSWHKGVVGIVASRIIEQSYKPTVVLCESNGKLTGSARSVRGFNIYEPLIACKDLFESFGGHDFAAGLTLSKNKYKEFKARFNKEVAERIEKSQLLPTIDIDAELSIKQINWSFYNTIQRFAPFGPENRTPKFRTLKLLDTGKSKLVGEHHLKLSLQDYEGNEINGIAFNMAHKLPLLEQGAIDVCYILNKNTWQGISSLQLLVRDIKKSSN